MGFRRGGARSRMRSSSSSSAAAMVGSLWVLLLLLLLGEPSRALDERGGNGGGGATQGGGPSPSSNDPSWYVRIPLQGLGVLQGVRSGGMDFFGGIPYAAPPVGSLRWAAPEEPPSWKPHVLDASQFGPDCYQVVDPVVNPLAEESQMSEDCLYLNVYTPAGSYNQHGGSGLPVMVWFHGGAFQQGAGNRPEYDGRRLAQEENVVVVTANYRLGALGFLVTSELGLLGNYGLMDQRAVLYWVQKHIASFGGDPDSVTLFGESAGAVMIGLHLLMDNPGLFHRAILQSNPMGYQFRSVVVADFLGDALRRAVDCRDLACLRGEPVEEILRAQSSLMGIPRSVGDFFAWGPTLTSPRQVTLQPGGGGGSGSFGARYSVLEERSLFSVEHYAKQRESTRFAVNVTQPLSNLHLVPDEIPIIIGTNKHEGEMFVHGVFPITMSKAVYWMFVGALFKDSASKVLKHYRPYVAQLEEEARAVAEKQLEEVEHQQYYHDHQDELEQEFFALLGNTKHGSNSTSSFASLFPDTDGESSAAEIVTPEAVEQLLQTFSSGGATNPNNSTAPPQQHQPWWKLAGRRIGEAQSPDAVAARRQAREMKIRERKRQKALKEAAKVVVDYRPVMSRIINDYLFRCPSWRYAQLLSGNRVRKQKTNNVYVYRFSQPTHVPGYKECWGKSCHTSELPYVFRSMEVIRSNYSTLSSYAQDEAPVAPEYPYTDLMNAYRSYLRESKGDEDKQSAKAEPLEDDETLGPREPSTQSSSLVNQTTTSFQRILKHFFDDYFQRDADDETAKDMARRWVAFARNGDPNYDGSKVEWIPWRYIPSDHKSDSVRSPSEYDREQMEEAFWSDAEDVASDLDGLEGAVAQGEDLQAWADERLGRAYRQRALQALSMEVVEEDALHTELRRTKQSKPDPDNPFFSLKFLSNLGITSWRTEEIDASETQSSSNLPREAVREIQRVAQEMGVLGTGVRGDERRGQQSHDSDTWDEDFFPQILELKWPPEERLVERDCSCDFWDWIRYRY